VKHVKKLRVICSNHFLDIVLGNNGKSQKMNEQEFAEVFGPPLPLAHLIKNEKDSE